MAKNEATGEDGATRGYSWLATGSSAGTLLGNVVGGLLVAAVGVRWALTADALTYLAQAALLTLVRAERRPTATRATGRPPHHRHERHGRFRRERHHRHEGRWGRWGGWGRG